MPGIIETFKAIDRDKLTPEFQTVYDQLTEAHKNMQADYTKKTTEIATQVKESETLRGQLSAYEQSLQAKTGQVNQLAKTLDDWNNWYDTVYKKDSEGVESAVKGIGGEPIVEKDRVEKLESMLTTLTKNYKETVDDLNQRLGFVVQLNELRTQKGNKFESAKVLKTALDNGLTDLAKAHDIAYQEDLFKERVDLEVAERVKAELDKQKKTLVGQGRGVPDYVTFSRPKAPRSYSEARSSISKHLATLED
jgi:chromosome segregation ATPase